MKHKARVIISIKGGPGSGNWGHRGIPGKVGGSSPRSAGLSPTSGKGWLKRYRLKIAESKKPVKTTKQPRRGGTPGKGSSFRSGELLDEGLVGSWTNANLEKKVAVKATVVDTLADETGITDSLINDIMGTWASTSNNGSPKMLSMQQAAAAEFDTELSDWQKTKITAVNAGDRGPVKGAMSRADERKLLRNMYDDTQVALSRQGYKPGDTVTLYRGAVLPYAKGRRKGGTLQYSGNAIESWTITESVAKKFAGEWRPELDRAQGMVFAMNVPIENIISTPRTGFGCLVEGEFIITGNVPSEVRITHKED